MIYILLIVLFKNGFEAESIDCNSVQRPSGYFMSVGEYKTYNDGFYFGQSTNTSFLLDIRTNRFWSLSGFSYPVNESRRRIVFVDAPTNHNLFNLGTISISECRGDFTETAVCVVPVHNRSTVMITTKQSDPGTGAFCKLDPSKQYYINYILSDDPFNELGSCANPSHSECAMFYTEAATN